jgi:acetylornithine deacetylase/succinyl-diaminopimelate desuccinylase-like protein
MACALLALARRRRPVTTEFVLVGLVDEEKSQSGSRAIARSGLKADLAIVGEPTGLQVVTAHKGDVWLKLETTGRAAHGATPHLGRNAIAAMARVVEALETDYAGRLKQQHHPLLGHPSINTGTIRGGHQPNIVPDHCEITVDRRMLPGETEPTVRGELRRWFREQGLPVRFGTYPKKASPALETDPDLPLVRRMLDAARQRGPAGVDYFCDASILAEAGMSSVVFGPGDIAQAHTADEWISCRELNQALEVLLRFLTTFD